MIQTYAVKCPNCKDGFVDEMLCAMCQGDCSILVPETKSRRFAIRTAALVLVLAFVGIAAYFAPGLFR
jgi:hypothetical protein